MLTGEQKAKDEEKQFKNTTMPDYKRKQKMGQKETNQERLKLKMEENREKYDFKYIKTKFNKDTNEKTYMTP